MTLQVFYNFITTGARFSELRIAILHERTSDLATEW